jgi:hypothetical protein
MQQLKNNSAIRLKQSPIMWSGVEQKGSTCFSATMHNLYKDDTWPWNIQTHT